VARVTSVPERGFKCRTVTASRAALVAALHPIRENVLRMLRKIPEVQTVLEGNRSLAVEDLFK